ncbi:MAG TPA: prolyl oligopeptidase family serine peptidase, partial [Fimbriimonadaceae bacterium]|nr:prolyl oligopeptidase family serine peptidase [Fimbriimonadaceae bacterium]
MIALSLLLASVSGTGPIQFGRRDIDQALRSTGLKPDVSVRVTGTGGPESYAIRYEPQRITIEAGGAVGAMYGELQAAEDIETKGPLALKPGRLVNGKPFLRDRGWNLFLTLPWDYAGNRPDYDPAALADPNRWYFQDDDYWQTLFDEMARARLNWLDIHGAYDLGSTLFPNLWAYFIQSDKYPKIGVAPEIKAKDLRQLNHVIEMAHARGVRVSLMCYEARAWTPHNPSPPYPSDEATMYGYTREVVEKAIRQIPKLDAIGFRIGESEHSEAFFNCYIEAVKRSGRKIPLLLRSWLTQKAQVVALARQCPDFTLQIKYNGEHWAAPYLIAGGRMPAQGSYSFENYLSDSGESVRSDGSVGPDPTNHKPQTTSHIWGGNPGGWPDQPYKIVWQVRTCGTNKIFVSYQPEFVRRTIRSMKIGTASGYTVEPENAYYPASPLYYLKNSKDAYCRWIHQRDELYLDLWGRMGYDPSTPETAFRLTLVKWFGKDADRVAFATKAASRINFLVSQAFDIGPDIRDHNVDMEWGGDNEFFTQCEGFDPHSFMTASEEAAILATGGEDGRTRPAEVAAELTSLAAQAKTGLARDPSGRAKEWDVSLRQQANLAHYYAWRLRAADDWVEGRPDLVKRDLEGSVRAWRALSDEPYFKPFTERLRMHVHDFAWRSELPKVQAEANAPHPTPAPIRVTAGAVAGAPHGILTWKADGNEIVCRVTGSAIDRVRLLVKALPSTGYFHALGMKRETRGFVARFPRETWGHMVAADVTGQRITIRIPSWQDGDPYLVVPARKGPTPMLYGPYDALPHLDPAKVDPTRFGPMIVCSRAAGFFSAGRAQKRKLLDIVERGGKLVFLQDPYGSGSYSLDWLPKPPKVEGYESNHFDPGGVLRLEPIASPGILTQRLAASPGWEIFGNGGLARCGWGKGEIWVCQARFLHNLIEPSAARDLLTLLQIGGGKPRILVDAGSDGSAIYNSVGVFVNFMNAHDIPYLTLGEVIAKVQGMNSTNIVPAKLRDDDVLQGKGHEAVVRLVVGKYLKAVSRPPAGTREEHEARKTTDRKILLQALGLDPMPPKTPLNARITGVIQRKGYRIEKIVFESRPGFPVTGHIYVPDAPPGRKFPVIMNPHGHWVHKKMEPTVQYRLIFEALHGYLAMIIDSPGESWEGGNLVERRYAGSHWDFSLVAGSMTANNAYIWDLIRAMDYLETRPDADMSRAGITGASGGGMATLYAFAVDNRYKCAVPVVYASSYQVGAEVHTTSGCECNYVPGVVRIGDRADVLAIRAPAPVFCIGATVDNDFPPEGTVLTGKKLKKIWDLYGKEGDASAKVYAG